MVPSATSLVEPTVSDSLAALRHALRAAPGVRLAIPLSGFPDPDSMASAWALAELATRAGCQAEILHLDPVSHIENRLMLRELGVPLLRRRPTEIARTRYDWFSLVDTNTLDPRYLSLATVPCLSVWDHHAGELARLPRVATISREVGATSTLAVQYLDAAGLLTPTTELVVGGRPPPGSDSGLARLTTALLLGIATDTEDYLLAHPADFAASAQAMALADRALFRRIHRRAYSVAAMEVLHRALESVTVQGSFGIAWVGSLPPSLRDAIPQAADLLVSRLDLETVVVYGQVGPTIDGSVRTLDPRVMPAELIARALRLETPRAGISGGGREAKGGFRWELTDPSSRTAAAIRAEIEAAFLACTREPTGSQPRPTP